MAFFNSGYVHEDLTEHVIPIQDDVQRSHHVNNDIVMDIAPHNMILPTHEPLRNNNYPESSYPIDASVIINNVNEREMPSEIHRQYEAIEMSEVNQNTSIHGTSQQMPPIETDPPVDYDTDSDTSIRTEDGNITRDTIIDFDPTIDVVTARASTFSSVDDGNTTRETITDFDTTTADACTTRRPTSTSTTFSTVDGDTPRTTIDSELMPSQKLRRIKSFKRRKVEFLDWQNEEKAEEDRLQSYKQRYGLESLTRATGLKIYGFKERIKDKLEYIHVWSRDFKVIEGQFGSAILSYFRFIRFLLFLNLFLSLVMFFVVSFPLILFGRTTFEDYTSDQKLERAFFINETIRCSKNYTDSFGIRPNSSIPIELQRVVEFLQGTGFMENTLLYYGYYMNATVQATELPIDGMTKYNMSLAYLLAIAVCFFISFLLILRNSADSMTSTTPIGDGIVTMFSNKVFCGWDYCISNQKKARLKHKNINNELTVDLDEQTRAAEIERRTLRMRCKLYTIRFTINVIVIILLVGSLAMVYIASNSSLKWQECRAAYSQEFVNLVMQYLPSVTITAVNVAIPLLFAIIVNFEEYSPAFRIYITLIRIVVLRLCSFAILVLSLYIQLLQDDTKAKTSEAKHSIIPGICSDTSSGRVHTNDCGNKDFTKFKCWETYVGQQIYKLVLLDFIVVVVKTFCVEFPRKLIYRKFHQSFSLIRWLGIQEFDLPENVLDLVYSQTLCWFGTFFTPLIPIMCTMKCLLIFYMKKTSLLSNCNPPERPYRASKSHSFFMLILLISFVLATLGVGFVVGNHSSSQSCGPFRLHSSKDFVIVDVMWNTLNSFPEHASKICLFITSAKFVVPAIFVLCITTYINLAFGDANKKKAKMLRDQLVMIGRDKRFLLDQIHAAERRRHVGRHMRP